MLAYLKLVFEAFRFIKRYRERQQAAQQFAALERAKEREHQRLMIEGIATKLVEFSRTNQEGLLKLAEASTAQAAVFQTWIDGFRPPSSDPIPSSRVTDEDEWEKEELSQAQVLSQLPPEFALAMSLNKIDSFKDPNPDFDREGRDHI